MKYGVDEHALAFYSPGNAREDLQSTLLLGRASPRPSVPGPYQIIRIITHHVRLPSLLGLRPFAPFAPTNQGSPFRFAAPKECAPQNNKITHLTQQPAAAAAAATAAGRPHLTCQRTQYRSRHAPLPPQPLVTRDVGLGRTNAVCCPAHALLAAHRQRL